MRGAITARTDRSTTTRSSTAHALTSTELDFWTRASPRTGVRHRIELTRTNRPTYTRSVNWSSASASRPTSYRLAKETAKVGRNMQWRRHGVGMSTPFLLEVAPEIDTNPTSFYRGRGRWGVGPVKVRTWLASRSHMLRARHVCPPHIFWPGDAPGNTCIPMELFKLEFVNCS